MNSAPPDLQTIRSKIAEQGTSFDKWCDTALDSTFTLNAPLSKEEIEARLVFIVVLLSISGCAECCSGTVCEKHADQRAEDPIRAQARQLLEKAFSAPTRQETYAELMARLKAGNLPMRDYGLLFEAGAREDKVFTIKLGPKEEIQWVPSST